MTSIPMAKGAKPLPEKRSLDNTMSDEATEPQSKKRKTPRKNVLGKPTSQTQKAEKRPRRWRSHPPTSWQERFERAMSQRMFVLDRNRNMDTPSEEISIAGTTGNLYTVTICSVPSCSCPDAAKGNQCKHIIYALTRILKVTGELRYQLSFLPAELITIFDASPLPTDDADAEHPNNRKPISGDCPICFCDMDDDDPKDIVWCKAACGNNLHKACFEQWARSSTGNVRCVYCRTEWESMGAGSDGWKGTPEELAALKANATVDGNGFANIASQLGLSGARDYSTYHQPWVNSRSGYGRSYGGGWSRRRFA